MPPKLSIMAIGFLSFLSLLVFFLGMCVMGCHRAERPRVMSPWSESAPGSARGVQASQGTRTSCPTVDTHPAGGAVVGASIPMWQPLLGVLGSHSPYLGMGRSEARQDPFSEDCSGLSQCQCRGPPREEGAAIMEHCDLTLLEVPC